PLPPAGGKGRAAEEGAPSGSGSQVAPGLPGRAARRRRADRADQEQGEAAAHGEGGAATAGEGGGCAARALARAEGGRAHARAALSVQRPCSPKTSRIALAISPSVERAFTAATMRGTTFSVPSAARLTSERARVAAESTRRRRNAFRRLTCRFSSSGSSRSVSNGGSPETANSFTPTTICCFSSTAFCAA